MTRVTPMALAVGLALSAAAPVAEAFSFDGDTQNGSILLVREDGQLTWAKHNPAAMASPIQGMFTHNVSSDGGVTDKPLGVVVGDFDGDANGDVLVARSGPAPQGFLTWVERMDQLDPMPDTITGRHTFNLTPQNSIAIGELGDGAFDDVVVGRENDKISWAFENPNAPGSITATTAYNVTGPVGVAIGDWDGDANGDVLVAKSNGSVTWTERVDQPDPTFDTLTGRFTFNIASPINIVMGDANDDGLDDAFVGRSDGGITWLHNGDGTNITARSTFNTSGLADLAFGDVGDDGIGDVFVAKTDGDILWLEANTVAGTLNGVDSITAAIPAVGTDLTAIDVGSFDGDSDLDIIVGRSEGGGTSGSLGWYEVVGGVLVERQQFFNIGGALTDLTLVDPEPLALLLGDADNSGTVTADDLIAVQQNFGNVGPNGDGTDLGDANDDGTVTADDLIAVQQNFGNILGAAPVPVPEPAVSALVAVGASAMGARRPRR